jgi:hypothetical protein
MSTGRSERPLPLPSNVTTLCRRARKWICAFQTREWVIGAAGMSSSVGAPSPWTS